LHIAHLSGKRQQDRSFCAAKNIISIKPADKSGPLDFIQQAQVPVGQTLGLRVINRNKIDEKTHRLGIGPQMLLHPLADLIVSATRLFGTVIIAT
jgi:hypothetical protein